MRPLVMSWAALHDIERFGYARAEVRTMVSGSLCGCVDLSSGVRVRLAPVALCTIFARLSWAGSPVHFGLRS